MLKKGSGGNHLGSAFKLIKSISLVCWPKALSAICSPNNVPKPIPAPLKQD